MSSSSRMYPFKFMSSYLSSEYSRASLHSCTSSQPWVSDWTFRSCSTICMDNDYPVSKLQLNYCQCSGIPLHMTSLSLFLLFWIDPMLPYVNLPMSSFFILLHFIRLYDECKGLSWRMKNILLNNLINVPQLVNKFNFHTIPRNVLTII